MRMHKTKKEAEEILNVMFDIAYARLESKQETALREPTKINVIKLIEAQARLRYIADIHTALEFYR